MKVKKNQSVSYNTLLSYTCNISKKETIDLVRYMCRNMDALQNNINGPPLIKCCENGSDEKIEIMIPIAENRYDIQPEFTYIHNFNLDNVVSYRYTGSFDKLEEAKNNFEKYINENNYSKNSMFYYSVLNIDPNDNHTIDIIVSVK